MAWWITLSKFWKNNKANDRSHLIHADGDAYDGDLNDDKAHENIEMQKLL